MNCKKTNTYLNKELFLEKVSESMQKYWAMLHVPRQMV